MSRLERCFFSYGLIMVGAIMVYLFVDQGGGIYGAMVSLVGIFLSKGIIFLFLSFINFSLSIAFDNFVRADPFFYFYDGNGVDAGYLCLISTLIYCAIGILDTLRSSGTGKDLLIDFKFPVVSPLLFWPFIILIAWAALFVFTNENFVLSSAYDAYDLQKYPFLEYMGLVIAFAIQSARGMGSRSLVRLAFAVSILYALVCLVTSYRMVAIICLLSVFMMAYNGKKIEKKVLVALWIFSYVGLTYISYWRVGHYDVSLENIFGYFDGRMDNTFTGVVETALIYTTISQAQSISENLLFMIGALLPVPNSLIPDSMLYVLDAANKYGYKIPGGGAFAGFVIYFNYLYLLPYLVYIYIAFKWSGRGGVASGMYFILFITITRWWLYGPYVIFKFLGVLLLLMMANGLAKTLVRPGGLALHRR